LIPSHPDVDALHLLLKDKRGVESMSRVGEYETPPMLYASYQAVIARDTYEQNLIAEGSLAERAASRLRLDGAWARWDSLEEFPEPVDDLDETLADDAAQAIFELIAIDDLAGDLGPDPTPLSSESLDIARYLTDVAAQERTGGSRHKIAIGDLSRQIGLPVAKVRRDLQAISEASTRPPSININFGENETINENAGRGNGKEKEAGADQ
jgi:hypothetical protein